MLLLVCAVYSRDTGRPAVWETSLWSQIHVLTIQLQYINPFISYYRYVFLYVPTLSQTPGILSLIQSDPKVTLFANSFCNIFSSYTLLPGDFSHRTFYITFPLCTLYSYAHIHNTNSIEAHSRTLLLRKLSIQYIFPSHNNLLHTLLLTSITTFPKTSFLLSTSIHYSHTF